MSHKGVKKACQVRVSSKSVPEEVSSKSVLLESQEVSGKSVIQDCQARVSYKNVK